MISYPPPPGRADAHPPTAEGPGATGRREPVERRPQAADPPTAADHRLYILVVGSMAVFPTLWTDQDPQLRHLPESTASAGGAPFGFNILGCDYYSHAIYGAQPSWRSRSAPPWGSSSSAEPGPARRLLRRLGRHHHRGSSTSSCRCRSCSERSCSSPWSRSRTS